MGEQARVNSVLMLKQLRASLATFAQIASVAMEEAGTEIQRTLRWLREDQFRYWTLQVRARNERYVQAKLALKSKLVFDRTLAGTPSSCVDERKALAIAERKLHEAQHKLDRVKVWTLQIEKELSDYRGVMQKLASALEVDVPNARARLDNMIGALDAYLALAPPEMPTVKEETLDSDVLWHDPEQNVPTTEERAP